MLTTVYITNRREPMIQWFLDSLDRECDGDYSGLNVMVVDFYADEPGRKERFKALAHCPITHVTPKPTVWQGKHRLTKENYFAASNTRNTALCLAQDGYIAYADDLSVLVPGWLAQVRDAMNGGWIACGAFSKVKDLVVENGQIVSFAGWPDEPFPSIIPLPIQIMASAKQGYSKGFDSRWDAVNELEPFPCEGNFHYGCSLAMPVEALLAVNGFDEDCDSMSGEDYICGLMLRQKGFELRYCKRMLTLESEDLHFLEPPFKRIIKPKPGWKDSSHTILDWVRNGGRNRAPNYSDMRNLRSRVLAGEPFPVAQIPQHDWRDGQPINEM